jgi:predicted ATPase
MRIESIQIWNKFHEWEIDEINFESNLTLLVGISGVGKTQILRAIRDIQSIATGKSLNGYKWILKFASHTGNQFIWEGEFEVLEEHGKLLTSFLGDEDEDFTQKGQPQVLTELLTCNGETIFTRKDNIIDFRGQRMPKLSSNQSAMFVLKEEEVLQDAFDSFKRILFKDHTKRESGIGFSTKPIGQLKDKYKSLTEIRNSNEKLKVKAFLCSEASLPVFEEIKNRFFSIFPQVEDIRIQQIDRDDFPFRTDTTIPIISIKERGVQKWIREDFMSSGMLRTIDHICELYLINEGSILLIDEFENSLGTNCLNILTEDLIHENSGIQFIATSHHPYIINNIPYEYWKIVTRIGGHIVVKDAIDYSLGDSKQDAFIRLTKVLESQYKQ